MLFRSDEPNLTRYLKVNISLGVASRNKTTVAREVENNKPLLQNWLCSHLASQSMSRIKGESGQTRLRREIKDEFNNLLFLDGPEAIQQVLFLEFNVQ